MPRTSRRSKSSKRHKSRSSRYRKASRRKMLYRATSNIVNQGDHTLSYPTTDEIRQQVNAEIDTFFTNKFDEITADIITMMEQEVKIYSLCTQVGSFSFRLKKEGNQMKMQTMFVMDCFYSYSVEEEDAKPFKEDLFEVLLGKDVPKDRVVLKPYVPALSGPRQSADGAVYETLGRRSPEELAQYSKSTKQEIHSYVEDVINNFKTKSTDAATVFVDRMSQLAISSIPSSSDMME